jgi:hypothetical protein
MAISVVSKKKRQLLRTKINSSNSKETRAKLESDRKTMKKEITKKLKKKNLTKKCKILKN